MNREYEPYAVTRIHARQPFTKRKSRTLVQSNLERRLRNVHLHFEAIFRGKI
jgi:hypothetical protein